MDVKMIYDLIIIGTGPAGLTAGIYAARYKLNTLIIGKEMGGLATKANEIWNYPGFKKTNGVELTLKMIDQIKNLNVPLVNSEVIKITGKDQEFTVQTQKKSFTGKKIIFAGGTAQNKLGAKGESEFIGKGVSYCATCDAALFKDKIVGVVGGSDSALTTALLLTKYAKKVYIIYRKDKFIRAEPTWIEKVEKNKLIELLFEEEVVEVYGEGMMKGVKLKSGKDLALGGLFIEIGSAPHTYVLNDLGIKKDKAGFILTTKDTKTNIQGFYAAGDITDNSLKQIIVACGEGATAANSVYKDLRKDPTFK